jgi:hypothetical protein
MLKAPQRYLNSIVSNFGRANDLSALTLHLILKSSDNLHFIVDENELNLSDIFCSMSPRMTTLTNIVFSFREGQNVISSKHPKHGTFLIKGMNPIILLKEKGTTTHTKYPTTLDEFIPLTHSSIQQVGTINKRLTEFRELFNAKEQSDYFNNEKLLVIGNKNLFNSIPHCHPACFVENEDGNVEIKYNSPVLPKITFLKNINLLGRYLEKEINGEYVNFNACMFIGSSKFEHSVTTIRNYYNQRKFPRVIFIGEKEIKIDLGNNQTPLRWKWTIPEINFLKNRQLTEHQCLIIQNVELENAIDQFYRAIRDIETRHTISLSSLFRFVRRLYYDWGLTTEINNDKLNQIKEDFELALKELMQETFSNINPDFNFMEYHETIFSAFIEIINAIRLNNKTESIKKYQGKIHQFVTPSFLRSDYKSELNQIFQRAQKRAPSAASLEAFGSLDSIQYQYWNNKTRDYFSLTANTEVVSFARSDDTNEHYHKVISSIYGNGKIEKVIKRLAMAKTKYNLLLYSIEEKAFRFHLDKYVEELGREYASNDRYQICRVAFNDNYYQFSTFDALIEALALIQYDKDVDEYKLTFTDNFTIKLSSTKSVLKIGDSEKIVVRVEDLDINDKVQIYENPDKKTLRTIFELNYSELIRKADEYSKLWKQCLSDYLRTVIFEQQVYKELKNNGFSVSINTLRKYLCKDKEVMFPRKRIDLIAIAKTVNDSRLSFDFVRNTMLPFIHDYNGKMIEYGFRLSESINQFLITGEMDEFISEWYSKEEIERIVAQIQIKTIKNIELLTIKNEADE